MELKHRKRWRNHTGNQSVEPLAIAAVGDVADVVELIRRAEERDATVRAVGSGHSWSDAALSTGYVIETRGLSRWLELDEGTLRPGADPAFLVRVQAGMRIRELNAGLHERGLALPNMGGYDGQTVAGVVSTSTHGSGLAYGPLSSFVRSIDLVAAGGGRHRIERAGGPTAPGADLGEIALVQDDHWFDAALVGMGCLGVIEAVILEVGPAFWLRETRRLSTWEVVRGELAEAIAREPHYELCLNPYVHGDDGHRCLVTTRTPCASPEGLSRDERRRNLLTETLAGLPLVPKLLNLLADLKPDLAPKLLDMALKGLVDSDYSDVSYQVFNIGNANFVPAYSSEIGVPLEAAEAAVARILDIADQRRADGVYHTAPIALRFVKASPAYLSMMQGRDTMMIELIQMVDTEGGFELLADYEEALYDLGGRPHWGQVNTLTDTHLAALYPRLDDWLDVHARLNASGVFDSPFSKRVGISARGVRPAPAGPPEPSPAPRSPARSSGSARP